MNMKKKILIGSIIAVVILVLVSFSSVVGKVSLEPVPDLDCDGSCEWADVTPGETVTDMFTVENIGEPESVLNWEIESYPDWGTWTFVPNSGTGLLAGAPITVVVEVVFPDPPEEEQWSEILIVNIDNPDDFCVIDVYYHGKPVNDDAIPIEFKSQRIRDLVQSIDLWKIIVNSDALVETLEEISSILEEEDVRNYIEKTSDDDCGCEDESTTEWGFPMICTLLFPAWTIAGIILLVSNGVIWQPAGIMAQIGLSLNCYWIS